MHEQKLNLDLSAAYVHRLPVKIEHRLVYLTTRIDFYSQLLVGKKVLISILILI
jgi:hypothetical protein